MAFETKESALSKLRATGWFEDYLLAIGAFLSGIGLCQRLYRANTPDWVSIWWVLGVAGFILYANFSKQQKKRVEALKSQSRKDLEAVQASVYETLVNNWEQFSAPKSEDGQLIKMDHGLRICFFWHDRDNKKLEQITEYTSESDRGKKVGRRFPSHQGVIGRSVRLKQTAHAKFNFEEDEAEKFIAVMMKDYGYDQESVKDLSTGKQSWFATPILENELVVAVLYCDSNLYDFFSDEDEQRYNIITSAASGLSKHFDGS